MSARVSDQRGCQGVPERVPGIKRLSARECKESARVSKESVRVLERLRANARKSARILEREREMQETESTRIPEIKCHRVSERVQGFQRKYQNSKRECQGSGAIASECQRDCQDSRD